ncbi:CDP-alcohol phosphatidyltransferase [Microbacterium sp. DT81.1]|uniref:CDP-alcohol phosphatidyltransferase n=1 Tax=Microbacterium sp. DT81.1 TaxID=3393413 RepID=UPI003CEB24FC
MTADRDARFGEGDRLSRGARISTVAACAALLVVPLVPGALTTGTPAALLGVPAESLAIVLVLLIVVARPVRATAAGVFGAVVVSAILVAVLDLGFRAMIDRPFNLVEDGGAVLSAWGVVRDAAGTGNAILTVLLLAALAAAAAVALARAALRVGGAAAGAGRRGGIAVAAVTGAWLVGSLAGLQVLPGTPVAASRVEDTLIDSSARALTSIRDQRAFERALESDRLDGVPAQELLAALAGKDVVVAFVESYGRVAVEDSAFTDGIARALDEGGSLLEREGYSSRSAFLASPTFGGVSWLAHATLQSGVWVDSQAKYDRLMAGDRQTLSGAFARAGWRTVAVVPSNTRPWEAGASFYGFDTVLDSRNMGYRGPAFGYARMPDQYTWQVFSDRELGNGRQPVMAEIDLVSSHTPWTPLPSLVPWTRVGNGSVFAGQAAEAESPVIAWADPDRARVLYGRSVEYALRTIFSFLETYGDQDLVLVVLGDHQPARIVSGSEADGDVPVTIISKDPQVFASIASWRWEDGPRPSPDAPVWRMDRFRDRFVEAFSG